VSNAPAGFTVPIAVVLLLVAGVAAVTARGGWSGTLRRNGRLGVHSPAAVNSDESFAVANKVAAPVVAATAVLAIVFAILVVVLPVPISATIVMAVLGVLAAPVLLVAAGMLGDRAARAMPLPARRPQRSAACDGCGCRGAGCAGLTRTAVRVDAPASGGDQS